MLSFPRYLYGEPVEGVAYVMFGVEINGDKIRLPTMKQVKDVSETNCVENYCRHHLGK